MLCFVSVIENLKVDIAKLGVRMTTQERNAHSVSKATTVGKYSYCSVSKATTEGE